MEIERVSTVPVRLREAMNIAGKNLADLERDTGINRGTLSKYSTGKYEPKNKAITLMAKALSVDEQWLWGYDVPMERTPAQKKTDDLAKITARLRRERDISNYISEILALENAEALLRYTLEIGKRPNAEVLLKYMIEIAEAPDAEALLETTLTASSLTAVERKSVQQLVLTLSNK